MSFRYQQHLRILVSPIYLNNKSAFATIIAVMGLSRKNPHTTPPTDGVVFNPPPLLPGFPEAQDPSSCLDFQDKRPPYRLDFQEKILGLSLIYF